MELAKLFKNCLEMPYIKIGDKTDLAILRSGSRLYIYFEGSKDVTDWKNNFNFPAKPYRRMNDSVWYAHRGFLKVWETAVDYIKESIFDKKVKEIIIVGYSHGAALALLCHEYAWFHRCDIRNFVYGFGFGCPRVVWGFLTPSLKKRWQNFSVIRNINDIVTHLPPWIFGYRHVGNMITVGTKGRYTDIEAHHAENIMREIKNDRKSHTP